MSRFNVLLIVVLALYTLSSGVEGRKELHATGEITGTVARTCSAEAVIPSAQLWAVYVQCCDYSRQHADMESDVPLLGSGRTLQQSEHRMRHELLMTYACMTCIHSRIVCDCTDR